MRRNGFVIMANLILLLGDLLGIMLVAIINGCLGFISAMAVPLLGAVGIAKLLGEPIVLSYPTIITLTVLAGVLRGILRFFEQYSNHYIAFKLLAVLRDRIFAKLRILCPAKLESKQKGSIISMITSDIETLEVFYAHTISPICIAIIISSLVTVFVWQVSSIKLAFVALLGYLTIGIMVPLITSKKLKQSGVTYRREFALFNSYFLDSIKGIKDIVLHNAGNLRQQEVNQRSEKLLKETKKMKHETSKATAFTEFMVSLVVIVTLYVGIQLVYINELTIGQMVMGTVAVFGSFGPVIAISALPSNLTQTFASGDRVLNLLQEKPLVKDIKNKQNIQFNHLQVSNLTFGYDDETILNNINFTAYKGEIVGIVGDSGCGKSTFLKLLLRFWETNQGQILYNNEDIKNINTNSLLNNVTMVSQTTYLFDETIEENLKVAKENATTEEMIEACKMASIHDLIMSLPQGYQSPVGSLGDYLSAGEKQRLGLARAFLKGSDVILLDEPTSNVDSMNEGIILKALQQQKKNKCIILVSHRESTMAVADRVYRFENGHAYEQ